MIKAAELAALGGQKFGIVYNMASPAERITALEAKHAELVSASEAIANADSDDDLTDEQTETLANNAAEIGRLGKQIDALKAFAPKGQGRASKPEARDDVRSPKIPATVRDNARHNFTNMGEFAQGVRLQSLGQHDTEPVKKLFNAATTYGSEGVGTDGGFLVPPEFSRQLWQKVEAEENLMNRCAQLTPSGNSMTIPKDETTPWGTAGINVYWDGEAASLTQSKAAFESSTLRLHKLTALVPASDELLEDGSGYESFINAKVPGIIAAKINDKIVSGTGVGMPLGILNSASVLSVAKETSQPADTVWFANINKMWSRMYAPWRRNAVWLINQDIEPSLHGMAFQATGASSMLPGTSAVPAYLPMNGLSGSPYATLLGRPVVPVQACKTVGDQGDIILVDLNQYWILRKAGGVKTDTSIHLYFDQAVTAFRFLFRVNGQPAWNSSISPQNGSNTLSWAVVLDAR
jgi:HK97 family phage major capsid protein